MKPRLWFVFAALLSTTPASGQQCTDSTTYRYDTSAVTRPNGNEVDAQGQSQVFGNYQYWWKLYLDSTWSKQNGPTLGHNVGDTNSPGLTVSRLYQTTLQANGPGTYVLSNTHNAWNVYCSYWDNATVTGDQKAILRPARPDYASFYPRALWFLGAGITSDGSYPAQTVFAPGANNGAPESPQYVIANGGNRLSLSAQIAPVQPLQPLLVVPPANISTSRSTPHITASGRIRFFCLLIALGI